MCADGFRLAGLTETAYLFHYQLSLSLVIAVAGRQLRFRQISGKRPVKSGNGDIFGNAKSFRLKCVADSGSHTVVCAEYRTRDGLPFEYHVLGDKSGFGFEIIAVSYPVLAAGKAFLGHDLLPEAQPQLRIDFVLYPREEEGVCRFVVTDDMAYYAFVRVLIVTADTYAAGVSPALPDNGYLTDIRVMYDLFLKLCVVQVSRKYHNGGKLIVPYQLIYASRNVASALLPVIIHRAVEDNNTVSFFTSRFIKLCNEICLKECVCL